MTQEQTFSHRMRLTEARDFDRVFSAGRRSSDRLFTVLYRDTQLGYPRLGLAVAKRKISLAARRNHLKRLVRESFRQVAGDLGSLDIVVIPGNATATADNAAVFASLDDHWRRLSGA